MVPNEHWQNINIEQIFIEEYSSSFDDVSFLSTLRNVTFSAACNVISYLFHMVVIAATSHLQSYNLLHHCMVPQVGC